MQDVRLISLTPLAGSRGRIATTLARAIGDNDLLIMLSGPEGSGKSAILAAVVATLAYGGMRVIRVSNPDESTMGQRELAARILGRPTVGSPAQLVAEAITNLLASTDDGQVVLVVDDAHTLSDQAMELLMVINSPARRGARAPQLLLAGRGEFWNRPWRDELRTLTDLAEKVILEPLTTDDARDFVMDEAKASGGTISGVTPAALTALVRCSSGLNAQMDRIVTAAVALGNTRRATVLTEEVVDAVVTPDTMLELPCTDSGPLTVSERPETVPAMEAHVPPVPVARGKFPGGWPAIAVAVLVVVAGVSVALVSSHRAPVSTSVDRSAPVAAPAPAPGNDAATAPEPAKAALPRPGEETVTAPASGATSTTPDSAPPAATPPTNAAVPPSAPSLNPPASAATNGEPQGAAPEAAHPSAAPMTATHEPPITPAAEPTTPASHIPATPSPAEATNGGDKQAAPPSTASGTEPALAAHAPEAAKPEAPTVASAAPAASVTIAPAATQPAAVSSPPPIAPLPTAPPPAALLPAVPSPAASVPVVPPPAEPQAAPSPPAASPPAPAAPGETSLPPAVIAVLLQRGNEMLASGDILSARLYFERAGTAGSEDGEMGAARTYDPGYLATVDAPGLQADVKRAIDWYRIAATTHRNGEAQKRIDALTAAR